MARIFATPAGSSVNLVKSAANADWAGKFLFVLKELALLAGWSVRGSSDGVTWAYNGHTAALDVADQGNGGDFDAWQAGASRSGSSPHVPGDAGNASAWCVLRHDATGKELLLAQTSQTAANWDGYCRIANTRAGATFAGASAGATTIPGAPSDGADHEYWIVASRANPGGENAFLYGTGGRVHMWADDDSGSVGFCTVSAGLTGGRWASIERCDRPPTGDPDPWVLYSASGTTSFNGVGWNPSSAVFQTLRGLGTASTWPAAGAADPDGVTDAIVPPVPVTSSSPTVQKGATDGVWLSPVNRTWGFYGEDAVTGRAWATLNHLAWPWPSDAVTPEP